MTSERTPYGTRLRAPFFNVEVFGSGRPGSGSPAGVSLLATWPEAAVLARRAEAAGLPETAFVRAASLASILERRPAAARGASLSPLELRWYGRTGEVELCVHATLAAACVLRERYGLEDTEFATRKAGTLRVERDGDDYAVTLPPMALRETAMPPGLERILGANPSQVLRTEHHLVAVLDDERGVGEAAPQADDVASLGYFALVATAPAREADYCLRFFAPGKFALEDPATGVAQTFLAPLWAPRLGRRRLTARQLSPRGGYFRCIVGDADVRVAGLARIAGERASAP